MARIGQLRQSRAQLFNPGLNDSERRQVRLGEVTIVMRLFFAALRYRYALCFYPTSCLLMNSLPGTRHRYLPLRLVFKCALDRTKTIHVFDLGLDTQLLLSPRTNGNVGIATQASLFHTSRGYTKVDQDLA